MPELFDVIHRQRACRYFRTDPVPDELVARVLEAATHAPSAENSQPWVFVVVTDADRRRRIAEMASRVWTGWAREYSRPRLSDGMLDEVGDGTFGLADAPTVVVVCGDTELGLEAALPESVFPATQNLLLAAAASGLGSAFMTLPIYDGDALATLLRLPPHVKPMAVIPLGYPARPLGPPRRLPVAARAHRDEYGAGW